MGFGSRLAAPALALGILLCPSSWADDATSALQIIQAFDQASLGEAVAIQDVEVPLRHLRIRLASGTAAPLLVGDEKIGFFFSGEGTWTFLSTDADEHSAVKFNVDKATRLRTRKAEAGLAIEGAVKQLLIWARGQSLPDLEGPAAPSVADSFKNHRKLFKGSYVAPASHLFAQQVIDAPSTPLVRAEIQCGSDDLVYVHNEVESRDVTLDRLRKVPFTLPRGARYPIPLSRQPTDGSLRAFQEPAALLTHVGLDLTAEKQHAELTITETIQPKLRDQRVFRFELESRFFDDNAKERPWTVTSIRDDSGKDVPFHHAEDELLVAMPQTMKQNTPFTLHFELSGDILLRYGGINYWRMWTRAWYPRFARNGTYATFDTKIRIKAPDVPIAAGRTISRRQEGDYNILEVRLDHPVQYYTITAGKYRLSEEERDVLNVRVATYALDNKRATKKIMNLAHETIDFYETWLGPYPFKELQVVEAASLGWGQAPPTMMFITKEAFTPFFHAAWSKGINHRFAHEIAHQYWGHLIKWSSTEEQWFSESFADLSASFALKHLRGQTAYDDLFKTWQTNAEETGDRTSIAMANRVVMATDNSYMDRVNLLYDKGPLVLMKLREELGGALFAQLLNRYVEAMRWKFGNTEAFMKLVNNSTGKDYSEVFERYYWGTEMPRVKKPGQ